MLNHCLLYSTYFKISFFLISFYWSRVALQSCFSFCCTEKWISYMYTYNPSFLGFFTYLSHPRALDRVPWAIQYVLISYFFYTSVYTCVNPQHIYFRQGGWWYCVPYLYPPPSPTLDLLLLPVKKLVLKFPSVSSFASFSSCFLCFEALLLGMWIFMTCHPAVLSLWEVSLLSLEV